MQKDKQPELFKVNVVCNTCGAEFEVETTDSNMKKVDVCSNCHPFYAGTQKTVAKGGKIDKFYQKYQLKKENN